MFSHVMPTPAGIPSPRTRASARPSASCRHVVIIATGL